MRSRPKMRLSLRQLALAGIAASTFVAPPVFATEAGSAPTEEEMQRAVEKVRKDPNFGAEQAIKRLKWAGKNKPREQRDASGLEWLTGLFSWLASAGRLLLWVAGGLLVIVLIAYLTRFLSSRDSQLRRDRHVAPTHVGDLDIRPESLPDDIGAAAWTLWERGEQRAALSLLYRGLLSRLAHAHAVPIRDSSTEGECLALAQRHLSEQRSRYAAQLIRVWQRAVYGGLDPDAPTVRELCDHFSAALDAPSAAPLASQPA